MRIHKDAAEQDDELHQHERQEEPVWRERFLDHGRLLKIWKPRGSLSKSSLQPQTGLLVGLAGGGTTARVRPYPSMAAAHKVKGIILIVEDEPMIRGFMRDALEEGGYRAEEAGNAHQAMEMLENDGYKAVLTDIGMPGDLNGLDLAWAIEAKWPEIGVVVTSGQTLPAPDDLPPTARFVAKPIHVDVLLQAVKDVVED